MAYTKYSLTPANNNAAPPDGAPEGMLPSAVNDTMRDMMAQIRDVGDGIRGGTYTMTAPVITGGSITGVALSGNTLTNPVITGGSINNTPIGASTANTGAFTNLAYTGTLTGGTGVVNLGSGQFYKDASGNVGIGTSSTNNRLDVVSATNFGFRISDGTFTGIFTPSGLGGIAIGTTTNHPNIFISNNAERMRIDSSGNVGIGTGSPTKQLAIGSGAISTLGFTWTGDGLTKAGVEANHATGEVRYGAVTNYFPTFYSNNTERMRIDSSGNLLVGTTSARPNGLTADAQIVATTASATKFPIATSASLTAAQTAIVFTNPNGNVGSIQTSGSATSYVTSSDYRLKENIAPMQNALNVVQKLKPVTYNWKADGSAGQGFIAHELQAVVPDCVTGEKDAVDAEGNPVYQGIDTSFLTATLSAAIQELKAELDSVKAELQTLKGN